MKKLVLVAALFAGFSFTANANEFSDYLDAQYDISWAEETVFEEVHGSVSIDPLAAYQTEGDQTESDLDAGASSARIVDIAALDIVAKSVSPDDGVLFVNTYE